MVPCEPPSAAMARAREPGSTDLRHTAASLWLAEGNPSNAVKDWLGHSTVQVTVDRYGHLLPGAEEAANERADGTWLAAQSRRGQTAP
jgi:integrase